VILGVTLLVVALLDVNVGAWIRHLALRELRDDPSDFIARHILRSIPSVTRPREFVLGGFLAAYGVLKGGVVLAVLRHHRRVAIAGAIIFTLVALAAFGVLLHHPSLARGILGVLDLAVAVVMWREALSLHHRHMRAEAARKAA
jgi:uncharacterized membrane protein